MKKTDVDLLESIEDKNLGLRHVSFKFSTKEVIFNAIRMNFHRENQLRFEVLKGLKLRMKSNVKDKK